MSDGTPRPLRAALLAVQLPDVGDAAFAASIAELHRLGRTLGVDVVETITQRRAALHPGTVVGSGKLGSLKALTAGGAAAADAEAANDETEDDETEDDETEDDETEDDETEDQDTDPDIQASTEQVAGDPASAKVELVLVDHELSPSQARNL
jgi:GTPase